MKEEYTVYPCSGKKYNGEKAIISLTSWKARINTVSKTLFSLLQQCPGFHIVLVLSEEEFPEREKELPKDLMLFVENELIELLWVHNNYKAFKKVLFTMDKYRDVPVISADDDCIYTCNYAEQLYDKWLQNKKACISFYIYYYKRSPHTCGYATLHPPYCYGNILPLLKFSKLIDLNEDDNLYTAIRYVKNLKDGIALHKKFNEIAYIHDEINPLHDIYKNNNIVLFNNKIERMIKITSEYFNISN